MTRPLRRDVKIPMYWLIVGLAVVIVSPVLSVFASVTIAKRNSEHVIQVQRKAEEAAKTEARRLICVFFAANLDSYRETPPSTNSGRSIQGTYIDLYNLYGCQPPRNQ